MQNSCVRFYHAMQKRDNRSHVIFTRILFSICVQYACFYILYLKMYKYYLIFNILMTQLEAEKWRVLDRMVKKLIMSLTVALICYK